jgi:4'-phosphopantetheinyl transferase
VTRGLPILSTVLGNEVHVWRAELDRDGSRRALRQLLGCYLDADPEAVELRLGRHGKPALADPEIPLRFNLSHSGGVALFAFAEREVGVDIERIAPRRDLLRLAERALGAERAASIRAAPPTERLPAFHRAWTRHEATLKCLGVGLGGPMPPAPTRVAVSALDAGTGFAAALAVAGGATPPLRRLSL